MKTNRKGKTEMARTATQKKRLLKWAKELRKLKLDKEHRFDMGTWIDTLYKQSDGAITPELMDRDYQRHKPCGFAACAVGWLPFMFSRFGDCIADENDIETYDYPGEDEVSEYFGLSEDEFGLIAYPNNYKTLEDRIKPKMVANRIERIAEGKKVYAVRPR